VSRDAACRIVLVGMMGSGKSTIGRLLTAATGWRYVDNDVLVLRATGRTSRDLAEAQGEGPMRDAERVAADRALAERPPVIVGIAAGVIADERVRRALGTAGFVVWLRAGSAALTDRAPGAEHRPWLEAGNAEWLEATDRERAPLYASVADLIVDTDRLNPGDAVDRIVASVATLEACPPVSAPP
jgi:shikimate kinase